MRRQKNGAPDGHRPASLTVRQSHLGYSEFAWFVCPYAGQFYTSFCKLQRILKLNHRGHRDSQRK